MSRSDVEQLPECTRPAPSPRSAGRATRAEEGPDPAAPPRGAGRAVPRGRASARGVRVRAGLAAAVTTRGWTSAGIRNRLHGPWPRPIARCSTGPPAGSTSIVGRIAGPRGAPVPADDVRVPEPDGRRAPATLRVAGYDGFLASRRGILLTVGVADCVPAFLAAPRRDVVALLHAGWRGVRGGDRPPRDRGAGPRIRGAGRRGPRLVGSRHRALLLSGRRGGDRGARGHGRGRAHGGLAAGGRAPRLASTCGPRSPSRPRRRAWRRTRSPPRPSALRAIRGSTPTGVSRAAAGGCWPSRATRTRLPSGVCRRARLGYIRFEVGRNPHFFSSAAVESHA